MWMNKTSRAILISIALLFSFLFTPSIYAESGDTRLYKISVLVFKHLPADKDTSPRLVNRWTEKDLSESIDTATLPTQSSALSGSYYTLSRDKNYKILYSSAWIAPLKNENPTAFHFHKTPDNSESSFDGLINVTLKYNFDVHFQTQLTSDQKIISLNESYQTPSNQLQYIDGPVYGALVLITRYDGK